MKRSRIPKWLAAVMLVTTLWSGTPAFAYSVGKEEKITASEAEVARKGFDVSKDYAVWMAPNDKQISLYDLDDGTIEKIGNPDSDKSTPRVDGSYVVWIDSRHGGSDVYLYDVKKKTEKRLSTASKVLSELEIAGNYVVWEDGRNGGSDIYLYDLSKDAEVRVSTSKKANHPSVSTSGYVVWDDERNGNRDIYVYDISAKKEMAGVVRSGAQERPVIYGKQVVFEHNSDKLYRFTISSSSNNGKEMMDGVLPHLYKEEVVFLSGSKLMLGKVGKDKVERIATGVYTKSDMAPRLYDDYVVYVKSDKNGKMKLYLYDRKKKKNVELGAGAGDPSSPDASDKYIVYLSKSKSKTSVVLYDVNTETSRVISDTSQHKPVRPVVSNSYVVWYDKKQDGLMAYDIKNGTLTKVTSKSEEPSDEWYELDGNNLLWVDEDGRNKIMLTDLSTGKSSTIAKLKNDVIGVDIYGNYLVWAEEASRGRGTIYLYDLDDDDDLEIRRNVKIGNVTIGDNLVVWSEYTESGKQQGWDLYYYDIKRDRVQTFKRLNKGDQIEPQLSGTMLLFKDNSKSSNSRTYYYELYEADNDRFSDYIWSDKAEMKSARIGGNRVVWIDERDKDPAVYTLAFSR